MHKVSCALLTVALVGLGTVPAGSLAQARDLPAPRQITVRMAPSGVQAPDALAAGRYQLNVRTARHLPGLLQLVKPDRGYTRADLRADERRGRRGINRIQANLRFFGGTEVRAGGSGALWETLYAGRYWLAGFGPGGFSVKTVHVHGTPSPSAFPRVSAEATGTDKGLRLSRTAPQAGRMLVRNVSNEIDALFLLPLKKGTTYADFLRWLRRPNEDMPVRFRGARSTAALSPDAGYVLRYRLQAGDYVVISISSLMGLGPGSGPRQLFRPLTVRPRTGAKSARMAGTRGTEGFKSSPAAARRIERWLVTEDRKVSLLADRLVAGALTHS